MSDPIALFSSDEISPAEFGIFLEKIGGVVSPDDKLKGRFSRGNLHIWLFLSYKELNSLENNEKELIIKELGTAPCSCIVFEISRKPGAEQLAIELAITFSKRWKIVVFNCIDKVYSIQELSKINKL